MYLLDTNVISEIHKINSSKADLNVKAWADQADTASLFISAITLQELEIRVLIAKRKDDQKGELLRKWLDSQVKPAFAGRILPVDEKAAVQSALLNVSDSRPFRDSLLAVTALVHDLLLVSRNVKDFEGTGVKLLNQWL